MNTMDPSENSDEDEVGTPPPKWQCSRREFMAGLVTAPLMVVLNKIEACDRLQNDKGKELITALVNLVSAFDEQRTGNM
jgi:hypothetical protein